MNLAQCRIGDQGCKYLTNGICNCLETHSRETTKLSIELYYNNISDVSDLAKLLQTNCVKALNLSENKISNQGASIIAEKLKSNTSLKVLKLVGCDLKSKDIECLAKMLTTNNSLVELYCGGAQCDDAIKTLAHALTINHSLKILYLVNCGMTEKSFGRLAKSLQQNRSLERLNICNAIISMVPNNLPFTEESTSVLTVYLKNNKFLLHLILPVELKPSTAIVEKVINESRKRSGLPLIKVTGE